MKECDIQRKRREKDCSTPFKCLLPTRSPIKENITKVGRGILNGAWTWIQMRRTKNLGQQQNKWRKKDGKNSKRFLDTHFLVYEFIWTAIRTSTYIVHPFTENKSSFICYEIRIGNSYSYGWIQVARILHTCHFLTQNKKHCVNIPSYSYLHLSFALLVCFANFRSANRTTARVHDQ